MTLLYSLLNKFTGQMKQKKNFFSRKSEEIRQIY